MKKITKMMLCGAMIAMVAFFASCNKPSEKVEGTLKGYTLTTSQFFQNMFKNDESVTLTSVDKDNVDVAFTSATWGEFIINNADVANVNKGEYYSITGKGTCKMTNQGVTNSYDCELDGVYYSSSNATLTFKVPAVMGGTTIVFHAGDAPSEYLNPAE